MLTIEEIRQRLAGCNLRDVSRRADLHYNVVYRAVRQVDRNLSYRTVKALSDYVTDHKTDAEHVVS